MNTRTQQLSAAIATAVLLLYAPSVALAQDAPTPEQVRERWDKNLRGQQGAGAVREGGRRNAGRELGEGRRAGSPEGARKGGGGELREGRRPGSQDGARKGGGGGRRGGSRGR